MPACKDKKSTAGPPTETQLLILQILVAGIALELSRRAGLETVDRTCERHRDAALPNAGRAGKQKRRGQRVTRERTRQQRQQAAMAEYGTEH